MLVTRSNFDDVLERIASQPGWYALDTETTGLAPYKTDRLFSIIIASCHESWYFNFNAYEDAPLAVMLLEEHRVALQERIFSSTAHKWYLHNAKFDLHMLGVSGMELAGEVWCTYAHGRLLHNDLYGYGLDALGERWLGAKKSDAVKEYCDEHKLYDEVMKGKRKRRNYWFWKVPLHIVQEYAETDALLTFKLAEFERCGIVKCDTRYRNPEIQPPLEQVAQNERQLTKVLFRMERIGVKLDKAYAERAMETELATADAARETFKQHAGIEFDDTPTVLSRALVSMGVDVPKNKLGRPLVNKHVLEKIDHPAIKAVLEWRKSHKRAVTYYANFLAMADEHHVIHPDFHQGGTKTGRLSCRDPNLQNLSRPDKDNLVEQEDVFEVRRAFVPREDFCFFTPDYSQIEYRLMLEYAREMDVIAQVNAGVDVHTATADILGVSRFQAKTINFMLIYGGGIEKLAGMLKVSWDEAKKARSDYFKKLPGICRFIEAVRGKAAHSLTLFNWFGRRYSFANPDMTYTTGPNWLIQGGCADVLKIAMIRCDDYLQQQQARSRMVLNIHDQIVFELHKTELDLAKPLLDIMETVYQGKYLKLTADPAYSWRSLADEKEGFPELEASAA